MTEVANDCAICSRAVTAAPDVWFYEDEYWRVRHSNETNILGYLILESKRHFLDMSEATGDELAGYGPLLGRVMKALHAVIDCPRIYTFTLAEMVPHYHVHLIPRTGAIPRAYRGRGILSYPLQPPADPHLLAETSDRLRRALKLVAASGPRLGN